MLILTSKQRNKLQHALNGNGVFGNLIGQGLGALGSHVLPIPGINGKDLGGFLGGMLPFARGGVVPAYRRGGRVQRRKKIKSRK